MPQVLRCDQFAVVLIIGWLTFSCEIYLPRVFTDAIESGLTVTYDTIETLNATHEDIMEMVKWTDLMVFDYIIGQKDR